MSYAPETLGDEEDNGTMPENVAELAEAVVGHRIVSAELGRVDVPRKWGGDGTDNVEGLIITLDNGRRVVMEDSWDCCASTTLDAFLLHPERVDHIITGVGTTEKFEKWHVYADMGDVLELTVGWSAGNPFYYGYGFDIAVIPVVEGGEGDE